MSSYIDWPRYSRLTWIVAALLIVLLLLLWIAGFGPGSSSACCGRQVATAPAVPSTTLAPAPAPASPPVAPAPAPAVPPKPAGELVAVYQGSKVALTGAVADQATHDVLLKSAAAVYGAANVADQLRIDPATSAWACAAKPDELFAWLKSGMRSGVTCNADGVVLTGVVASKADEDARVQSAKEFFGPNANIVDKLVIVAALPTVSKAEDVHCGDSISAGITFATGSAVIDDAGRKLLDAIAPCLTGPYEIGGHTDSTGSDEVNLPLSKSRADAVRDYLTGKGIAAGNLTTAGFGAERPIADNSTEEGRSRNRRIEFIKK